MTDWSRIQRIELELAQAHGRNMRLTEERDSARRVAAAAAEGGGRSVSGVYQMTLTWASRDEWLDAGRVIAVGVRRSMWDLGDWWAFGVERGYGSGQAIADEIGIELQTIKDAAMVCRAIESSRRRDDSLSFSHHREVAALPPAEQDAWLGTAAERGLSKASLRAAIKGAHPDTDQWYTPSWLFDQLALTFDIDVCAPADPAQRSCPAGAYYTGNPDDGLTAPWHGTVWCNPPYSTPEAWIDRMTTHGDGVLLVHMSHNAHWATRAQHALDAVRLIQSMHFTRPAGSLQRPGYSLMLAAYGPTAVDALTRVHGDRVGPLWVPG